jgi:hypothetical protein
MPQVDPELIIVIQKNLLLRTPRLTLVLVDIILDVEEIICHGLKSKFVEKWGHTVEPTVEDD